MEIFDFVTQRYNTLNIYKRYWSWLLPINHPFFSSLLPAITASQNTTKLFSQLNQQQVLNFK